MTEDFIPATPRRAAKFITDMLGADDKTADALTRLGIQLRAGCARQGDYDAVEDAFADAYGMPRRKHKHPFVWRVKYWWHWHITDPVVYPVLFVIEDAWQFVTWHCRRKHKVGEQP